MNAFIISWDCEGLESIVPFIDEEKEAIFNLLANKPVSNKIAQTVGYMIMRAKVNSHRFYEIYSIQTVDDITQEDLKSLFDEAPQHAAELIRERGTKIYSDRQSPSRIKIR